MLAPETQLTLRGGKHAVPADGRRRRRAGAGSATASSIPGRAGRAVACRAASAASRCARGDVVRLEKVGRRAAWGRRADARFERVVDDVIDGYVSRDAAIAVYGVDPERLDAAVAPWV